MFNYIHQGLKHWQTAISSGIGFIGVITTLLYNAYLVRCAERRKREYDAKALCRALSVEIESIKVQAQYTIDEEAKSTDDPGNFLIRPINDTHIYDASRSTLLLLTEKQLSLVLNNYQFIELVRSRVLLIGKRKNVLESIKEDWIELNGKTTIEIYISNMAAIVQNADVTLKELKKCLLPE